MSNNKTLTYERKYQKAKLLVTLAKEAEDKLSLNNKYLLHLKRLEEQALRTNDELLTSRQKYLETSGDAITDLKESLMEIDRNKEAVDQRREKLDSLLVKFQQIELEPVLPPSLKQSVPALGSPKDDDGPKRVRSQIPGEKTRDVGCATSSGHEKYPKRHSANSIITRFDLPKDQDDFFLNFQSDLPPERTVKNLPPILEEEEELEEEEKILHGHFPIM